MDEPEPRPEPAPRLPFPGWAFWVTACVAAPLAAVATFLLAELGWPEIGMDGADPLAIVVLLSAAYGALLPRALPHVRAVPLTVRRGWALAGALTAGISALPWAFALLFAAFVLSCGESGCLS